MINNVYKIPVIAKEHNIPLDTLKWFGAFHNESHHPHIHLMLYSQSQDTPGHIDKKGIDHLRHMFGTSIFQDELKQKEANTKRFSTFVF